MKIVAITGNRADYDLMSYLYRRLGGDPEITFRLIVTGAHLTAGYENSLDEMRRDGNRFLACIEDIPPTDDLKARAQSVGLLMGPLADAIETFSPDLIIGAGDREEVPAAALAAVYMQIPFLHFFGGEHAADGHPDNLARNATSKMATVHFVSTEEHKRRLRAMGEAEGRIHVVGSIALDKFREEEGISRETLLAELGCSHFGDYAIVIYHPPTDIIGKNQEISNILDELAARDLCAFVSYPNTDFNNSSVSAAFQAYENDRRFCFFRSYGRNTFVNLYRNALLQIGNSSAGILEAASIPLPVVHVGSRNRNRAKQDNVLFVSGEREDIHQAVDRVLSPGFQEQLKTVRNSYGDGHSAEKAYRLIKTLNFGSLLLKTEDPLL